MKDKKVQMTMSETTRVSIYNKDTKETTIFEIKTTVEGNITITPTKGE